MSPLMLLENISLVLYFVLLFSKLVGYHWLQAIYRRLTKENWLNHGFLRSQDISMTVNSNQVFLPGVGEQGSFLFAIYKVIICKFI